MPRFTPTLQVMIPDGVDINLYDPNNTTPSNHEIWSFRLEYIASDHMAYYEFDSKRKLEVS